MGLCFLKLGECFLSQVREFFSYYVFKYVLRTFLFLFSLRDPYNVSISALDVVPEVSNYPQFFLCILDTCTSTGTGIILNRVQQLQRIHHETMLNIYYKLLKNSILIPESTGCTLHHRKPLATCNFFFKIYLFYFLAAVGLLYCMLVFSSCGKV